MSVSMLRVLRTHLLPYVLPGTSNFVHIKSIINSVTDAALAIRHSFGSVSLHTILKLMAIYTRYITRSTHFRVSGWNILVYTQ